jgi:hypothetical protein
MKRWYHIAKSMKLPKQATAHMLHTAKGEEKKRNNWFTPIITLFKSITMFYVTDNIPRNFPQTFRLKSLNNVMTP